MRIIVMILSLTSVVFFGKALAGLGSYLVGKDHPELIAIGLIGGIASAVAALVLWKRYLVKLQEELDDRTGE